MSKALFSRRNLGYPTEINNVWYSDTYMGIKKVIKTGVIWDVYLLFCRCEKLLV